MKVVFVHGVSTRSGAAYDAEVKLRTKLLKEVAFAGRDVSIDNPLWGNQVPDLAWGGKCFPRFASGVSSFSLTGPAAASLSIGAPGAVLPLTSMAGADANGAVDTLFVALLQAAEERGGINAQEFAEFAAAARHIETKGFTPALGTAASDEDLVDAMRAQMQTANSYGIVDNVKEAAKGIFDGARNLASSGLVALFRDDLNPKVAQFIGDVFRYLKEGEIRNAIRAKVLPSLLAAHNRNPGESLVLIGHSLGGVILYDMLSSAEAVGLPNDYKVDLFLTVGSQPGLFEELKLFQANAPPVDGKIDGPPCVEKWLNAYDPVDLFGFRAEPVFKKAKDLVFNSATGLIDAHTTYFKRPGFHARLHERAAGLQ